MNKFWTDICLIPFVVLAMVGGMYAIDQAMHSLNEKNKTQPKEFNLVSNGDCEVIKSFCNSLLASIELERATQPALHETQAAKQPQAPPRPIAEVQNLTAWLWAM